MNSSESDGKICFHQKPYVRSVAEKYNITVVQTFVGLCAGISGEVPLNDGTDLCRFTK